MKYTEFNLSDDKERRKFQSIEKATNPGRDVKGYIYAILNQGRLRTGVHSVKARPPYEHFSANQYLAPSERACIVVLSEPHIQYRTNLQLITLMDGFAEVKKNDDLNGFIKILEMLAIDGTLETDTPPKQEVKTKEVRDLPYGSMDKWDLCKAIYETHEKIEKLNAEIDELKQEREKIHTSMKNAETRLKQIL